MCGVLAPQRPGLHWAWRASPGRAEARLSSLSGLSPRLAALGRRAGDQADQVLAALDDLKLAPRHSAYRAVVCHAPDDHEVVSAERRRKRCYSVTLHHTHPWRRDAHAEAVQRPESSIGRRRVSRRTGRTLAQDQGCAGVLFLEGREHPGFRCYSPTGCTAPCASSHLASPDASQHPRTRRKTFSTSNKYSCS